MGGFKSDIHRLLMNPLYHGEFVWVGKWYQGSHEPLVTRDLFEQVQAVLQRKPRARKPKQRHAFMGLLACASCGCAITAELKKGKYVYYHCTDFKGGCDNTYVRQKRLSELLADVIRPIQIPADVTDWIANEIRGTDGDAVKHQAEAIRQLDQRRRAVLAKMDRGYEDFIEARISEEFWIRKSKQWEDELRVIDAERARAEAPRAPLAVSAEKILELAKQARKSL